MSTFAGRFVAVTILNSGPNERRKDVSWDDRRRSWFCRTQSGKPWCDGRDVQSLPSHSHCGVASCSPVRVIKTMQARPISRSPQSLGSRCRRLGNGDSGSSSTDLRGSMMKLVLERHARSPMSRSRRWLSKSWSRYRSMRPTGARERWPRRLDSRNRRLFGSGTRSPFTPSDRYIQTVDRSTFH